MPLLEYIDFPRGDYSLNPKVIFPNFLLKVAVKHLRRTLYGHRWFYKHQQLLNQYEYIPQKDRQPISFRNRRVKLQKTHCCHPQLDAENPHFYNRPILRHKMKLQKDPEWERELLQFRDSNNLNHRNNVV